MAVLTMKTMGELNQEHRPMYPLFSKASRPLQIPSKKCDDQIFSATSEGQSASDAEIKTASKPASKRPKKPSKPSGLTKPTTSVPSLEHGELLEVDPNNCRRKRRKTDSPGAKEAQDNTGEGSVEVIPTSPLQERQQKNSGDSEFSILTPGDRESTPMTELPSLKPSIETEDSNHKLQTPDKNQHAIPMIQAGEISSRKLDEALEKASSSSIAANESKDGATTREDKPKKVLRLNPKTGTIGSPPAKNVKPPGDRTRKRTSTNNDQNSNSRIAIFRYGPGQFLPSSIGLKIGQILNKKKLPPSLLEKMELPKVSNIDLVKPPKSVHPLFLGKAAAKPSSPIAKQSSPAMDPQRLIEATILGRTKPRSCDGLVSPSKSKIPVSSSFRSTTKILKFPGAVEPAWPWRGMVHIRGQAQRRDELEQQNNHEEIRSRIKKSKYQAVEVLAQEDIISSLAHDLRIGELAKCIQEINLDEFAPLPECLRLPVKHFEAGTDLQRRVRKELCARLPLHKNTDQSSSEDELQGSGSTRARVHPALTKAFGSIATSLSAFDQGQCETQSWIHKHAPKSAAEVLQTGKEAFILKEWLQTLTVLAVETGTSDRSGSRASSVSRRSAASKHENLGKRKRKAKKLEGFVVSSEEEDNDMDEISEPEDDISPHGTQGLLKKTVIRAGDVAVRGSKESVKLTNAVVISGPHGSGKTAAAYAVAKELGFEVFEINSSSRRSGKDILEKVGDMTRNHLVQHAQNQIPVDPVDEDAQRISDALADDLKSGRQGTMKSFFKSKASAKAKPKSKKPTPAKETTEAKTSSDPKAPAKQQKQSLVLLEEVDVLYEEDKQFWATVINLLAQSKRPIIMTCNDESALPFQSLYLHAIIRFMPPPVDLAVDYMLLVAACEGHALRREPVKALYESRNSDLRASLTELDFWCQFAVGDFKCGLDWYYPRWPRGSDIDMQGNVIRVVSEGSFETGMGWLSQDFLESHLHYLDIEEEMLHEALVGWHLDVGDWQQNLNMTVWAEKTRTGSAGKIDDHAALNMYANFSDAMSVADLCSGTTFAPNDRVVLDSTLPELSAKARDDYILAHELLEASPLVSFDTLSMDISLWMKSRARKDLQVDQHIQHGFEVPKELDRPSESDVHQLITKQSSCPDTTICRGDFSLAFDIISEAEKGPLYNKGPLEASSFDRTTTLIATDLAPYVRSIVSYDARLQQDRALMSNLLSEGGRRGKRMRTTRSAMSALEGGTRSTTRRDKYFGPDLNPYLVLKTGMQSWLDASLEITNASSRSRRSSKGDSETSGHDLESGQDESMTDSL